MADESEKQELITQFTSVTGIESDRARFYLESSAWQLQFALSEFYDDGGEEMAAIEEEPSAPPVTVESETNTRSDTSSRGNYSRFGTIASFNTAEENEDSDEEGQAFYAGGSEHSGQQIVGPPRKKKEKSSNEMTQSIFDAAKRHGAEVVDSTQEESERKKKSSAFGGSGYRLGDAEGLSNAVNVPTAARFAPAETVEVSLTFWSNGFSVDNGPLRDFNDPENAVFLDAVKRGEIPRELLSLNRGGEVHVNMVDNRHEDYVKPKETVKAFAGEGHKLGSPAPKVVSSHSTPSSSTRTSSQAPSVDDSQPVTNLQIRLADGTRLVAKFNHTNTINDVRNFVNASRPQTAGHNFVLMTTFPNKELTDESVTLSDAKLLNAVVVQRYK